ncbi:MAG: dephospho-CoA kinase [Pseudomonadota bacterium]
MTDSSATGPRIVVLTGGIASGKTSVSNRLAAAGFTIIDTDVIARDVVQPGSRGLAKIVEVFGDDILQINGALDRRAMRNRIFASTSARQRLEAITHPLIDEEVWEQIAAASDRAVVILVVPLLVESGLFGDADEVIVIDVPAAAQIARLQSRDGMDLEGAERILAAQASREQRLARADHVIDNSGSLVRLEKQIDAHIERLKAF